MGEPAYQLPEEDRPEIRPDLPGLRALEGGGEGDGVPQGNLKAAKNPDNANSDASKGLYNPNDDKTDSSSSLAAAEAGIGGLANTAGQLGKGFSGGATSKAQAVKSILWGNNKRKSGTVGGGVVGSFVAIAFVIMGISSGPGQAIHLAQILMQTDRGNENATSLRVTRLWRAARANDIGETRVGKLGSLTFSKTTAQLGDMGIEVQRNGLTGRPVSFEVKGTKLAERYPELKTMSSAEARTFIADKLSLSPADLKNLGGKNFSIDTQKFNIRQTRVLTKNTLSLLGDGKIVASIKFRTLAKFYDIPSLFHPIKAASSNQAAKLTTAQARRVAEEERAKARAIKPSAETLEAEKNIKDKMSGVKGKIGGALLLTGGMCLARSIADGVVAINRAFIVAPAVVEAADKTAVGSQAMSGMDIDLQSVGTVTQNFTDDNGHSVWESQPLQELADPAHAKGADLPPDYKEAFSKDTTKATILSTLGGGNTGAIVCSPVGQAVQVVAGVALIVTGPFDEGASWAAFAAIKGAELAATAGAFYMIQTHLSEILASDAIIPKVLSGPTGGSLLAYGAREGSNISARASGGVALSDSEALALNKQLDAQDAQEFASKSLFARMFDTHDYRSLASRVIDSESTSPAQNINKMAVGLVSVNKWFSTIASAFSPRVHAADTPYDWGFPQYGIPTSILTNPNYEDPYDNADKVAKLLDDDTNGYIGRAKTCFGVTLSQDSGDWNAIADEDVNPNDENYLGKSCADTSDPNWQRVMLFIFDTRTMAAVACYQGVDQQSCTDAGVGTAASATTTTTGTGTGVSADGFFFPLQTTKAAVKNDPGEGASWCYASLTSCHHDYNAADIFVPTGTPVLAAVGGTVASAKDVSKYPSGIGSRVGIKGKDGNLYYYAHMGANTLVVKTGQTITAGQKIGEVGTDANALGRTRHLHFDILPPSYDQRMSCEAAACSGFPFINPQPALVNAFKNLP